MTVALSISGIAPSPHAVGRILAEARRLAEDLGWTVEEVHQKYAHATLRTKEGGTSRLEATEVKGVALVPHFACEGVPFIFLPDGTLVDGYVEDGDGTAPTLYPMALVKTHFAGPAVHKEVCEFLADVKKSVFPSLVVDDESGWFTTRNDDALDHTFVEAWEELRRRVDDPTRAPGTAFEIGDFPFETPAGPPEGEWAAIDDEGRALVETLADDFVREFGTYGNRLDYSRASVDDLELLVDDQAVERMVDDDVLRALGKESEAPSPLENPELEAWAHGAGAYLGRTIIRLLGGEWVNLPDEGLLIRNVGGTGLVVNPFRAVAERLAFHEPWNLAYQFHAWESLTKALAPRA